MHFTLDQSIDRSVEAVEHALFDDRFVTATSSLPRVADCELVSVERSGTSVAARIHRRFDAPLNAAVRRAIDPQKLTWVEETQYDCERHAGRHRIVADHYGDRLHCEYRSALVASDGGTRRTSSGTMKVKVPLVGGQVERAIVSGLEEYAAAEARLLGEWS